MYCASRQRRKTKPGPEELRAAFKRSVTVLPGSGDIHAPLFCLCDRTGLKGELATMTHVLSKHTCWKGAFRLWTTLLYFEAKAEGAKMGAVARSTKMR